MNDLFPTEFLQAIEALRLYVGPLAPNVGHGEHRQPHPGSGAEFRDYQAYSPGDDLRRVDWNIYRRSGHLFLRRFDQMDPVPVYVLLDTSASMSFENSPKRTAAVRLSGAIAIAALRQQDSVSILPFADRPLPGLEGLSGRNKKLKVLNFLSQLPAGGPTDFVRAVEMLSAHIRKRGIAVLVSDFLDESGLAGVMQAVKSLQHRVVLVRVATQSDSQPVLAGAAELVDCEHGRRQNVDVNSDTLARYRSLYEEYTANVADFAYQYGARYYVVDADAPALSQLAGLFPGGAMSV